MNSREANTTNFEILQNNIMNSSNTKQKQKSCPSEIAKQVFYLKKMEMKNIDIFKDYELLIPRNSSPTSGDLSFTRNDYFCGTLRLLFYG